VRFVISTLLAVFGTAQEDHSRHAHAVAGLGTVDFPTSCTAMAQKIDLSRCSVTPFVRIRGKLASRSTMPRRETRPARWVIGVSRGPGITRSGRHRRRMRCGKVPRLLIELWPSTPRLPASATTSMRSRCSTRTGRGWIIRRGRKLRTGFA